MSAIARPLALLAASASVATGALVLPATTADAATPRPYVMNQGRVTSHALTIRAKATAASTAVGYLRNGAAVDPVCSVRGQSVGGNRTWYWTSQSRTPGWVSARYVRVSRTVPTCSSYGFVPMHVVIHKASDVSKLTGTSAGFRAAMAQEITTLRKEEPTNVPAEIVVSGWWANDQAIGAVLHAGGARALWTLKNGRWIESGFQEAPLCSTMRAAGARHAIPGNTGMTCRIGNRTVEYSPKA